MLKFLNGSKYIGLIFLGGLSIGFGAGVIIGSLLCLLTIKIFTIYG